MKKAILIHGWRGNPKNHWFPFVQETLEKEGFVVVAPEMPYEETNRDIELWTSIIREAVEEEDELYIVGHSLGGYVALKFIEKYVGKLNIKGAVFVAPWVDISQKIDFEKIKTLKNLFLVFSDNDSLVSEDIGFFLQEKLRCKSSIEKGKGHFTTKNEVFELPAVTKALLEFSKG